ncbi:cc-nbs-lrr resistance protein [Corchorus olitorius]|uniref:Cc-nbs-lrr resistance protein n=1 Tax=Corchorus olitorius TaxID=93759 RepID=A0A1R3L430_9ROSI|nr:cc-nbs-lrr resistance protein [Corchorus olitorius]
MDWLVFKVLEKVSEVAESEVRLVTGVNEDVKKLRSTFQTIRAVLEDAEKRQVREKAVKIWLDKLQNVAYDMEDVLDEWNTAILKSQIPEDDPSSSTLPSKVCSNLIQPTSMSIRRVVQRRDIADKIKELNERLQAISKEKDDFAFLVDLTRNHNELKTERQKTTSFVHVSQIRDLGKLIHLRGKLLIKGLGNVGEASEAMEARLWTKAGLQELSLDFSDGYDDGADDEERQKRKEEEALLLQTLHPPPHLRTLRISRYKGPAFPTWTTSLTLLKSVELSYCDNLESLPPMGKLPSLESLSIWVMPKLKKVGEEFMGVGTKEGQTSTSSVDHNIAFFPNLKQLEFNFIRQWEEWEYETLVLRSRAGGDNSSSSSNVPIIMPKLQRLSIYFCPMLKSLPSHLLRSRALQELEIKGNPILHRRFNKETGEDWSSISHIPIIKLIGRSWIIMHTRSSSPNGRGWKSTFQQQRSAAKERDNNGYCKTYCWAAKLDMKLEWIEYGVNSQLQLFRGWETLPADIAYVYMKILKEECVAIPWKKGDVLHS